MKLGWQYMVKSLGSLWRLCAPTSRDSSEEYFAKLLGWFTVGLGGLSQLPVKFLIFAFLIFTFLIFILLFFTAILSTLYSPQEKQLSKAPGSILLSIVDFLYSKNSVENTFKPIIADWRYEYFDALKEGRTVKARWISVRYTYAFIGAMGINKVLYLIKSFTSASK